VLKAPGKHAICFDYLSALKFLINSKNHSYYLLILRNLVKNQLPKIKLICIPPATSA